MVIDNDSQGPPRVDIAVDGDYIRISYRGSFSDAEIDEALAEVAAVVRQPGKQWLALSDFSDLRITERGAQQSIVQFGRDNRPYVKRGAVVGLSGLKRFIFDFVVRVSGRKDTLRRFESVADAKAWLRDGDATG